MSLQAKGSAGAVRAEDWAGEMGVKWLANLERFEGMIAPIGNALLERAAYQPGERVVDIGSGGGATTWAIAQKVGASGEVVGIDVSPALTQAAAKRGPVEGDANAQFVCADASTFIPDDLPFDRLFSRFGSMFFEEPVPAFANLRSMLRDGARIDLAVWATPQDNRWMAEVMNVVRRHVEVPPAIPRAPGPFAFEDLNFLDEVLVSAGFSKIEVDAYEGLQPIGGPEATPDDAIKFALLSMAAGRILETQPVSIRERVSAELLEVFQRHYIPQQGVMMRCKAWLVNATA